MPLVQIPPPPTEVQRQLDLATSQMTLYARDLRRMVDAERQKAHALAEANARLAILDQMKTDFLSFIAHELRTPLTYMVGLDILNPHDDPCTQAKLIDLLRSGYERLKQFMEKGLAYFEWLAAEKPVNLSATTDLAALARWVAKSLPGLTAPDVKFQLSVPEEPCVVRGEEAHLMTVVQNLLDNALKFSEREKEIQVTVQATATHITLIVADRGQGFSPELGAELFRPFTIAQVSQHSRGTGLNLALASAIVTAYSGRMQAESAGAGQGATFTVALPRVSGENR